MEMEKLFKIGDIVEVELPTLGNRSIYRIHEGWKVLYIPNGPDDMWHFDTGDYIVYVNPIMVRKARNG